MMVQVRIPSSLRKFANGQTELALPPGDLAQLLAYLKENHELLHESIHLPSGGFRPFVKIFINQTEATAARASETAIQPGDVVHIVSAIAGG
jgi:molybdopterin converting factor small subunit